MFSSSARLALDLFDVGAFKDKTSSPGGKGFKLKIHEKNPDAPLSPFYFNLRTADNPGMKGPLTAKLLKDIGRELWDMVTHKDLCFQGVAGLPNAGLPLAKAFCVAAYEAERRSRDLHNIILRKESVEGRRRITGIVDNDGSSEGHQILLIDDLITGADTKLEAVQLLRNLDYDVEDALVLVDRQQGGAVKLFNEGCCSLYSLFTIEWLLGLYVETERITVAMRDEIMEYTKD